MTGPIARRVAEGRQPGAALAMAAILCALLSVPGPARAAGPTLAECDAEVAEDSERRESWGCYYEAARGGIELATAEARLRAAIAAHPGEHGYDLLTLANLVSPRDPEAGVALYEQALARFRAREDDLPLTLTALNLAHRYRTGGEVDKAAAILVEAERAAERHGEARWIATVKSERVRHMLRTGGDLSAARRLLAEVEPLLFPDGDYQAQLNWLNSAGMVNTALGRSTAAEVHYDRLIAIAQAREDRYAESNARYNRVLRTLERRDIAGKPTDDPETLAELEGIEAVAHAGGNQAVEIEAQCLRAELLGSEPSLRACVAAAREFGDPRLFTDAAIGLAFALAKTDPDPARIAEAFALLDEARRESEDNQDLEQVARVFGRVAELRWWVGPIDEAIGASEAALSKIEALRAEQQDAEGRAALKSQWVASYERAIGHLLGGARVGGEDASPSAEDLARAFAISERMRAQELREALGEAGVASRGAKLHAQADYQAVARELSAIQIELSDPGLGGPERAAAITTLEALERREQGLRAASDPSSPDPSSPTASGPAASGPAASGPDPSAEIATLAQVQASLGPSEALLVYQLANGGELPGSWAGGAWLLVVTRERASAHRLADERELAPRIDLFGPLLARREGGEAEASARLWSALLSDGLAELPASIDSLTIVPDGALHRLPFAGLRSAAAAPSLAERYAVDLAPSATSLVRWRERRDQAGALALPTPVLALADPVVEREPAQLYASAIFPGERGGSMTEGLRLASLPRARLEAERAVAGGGDLRLGEAAGEVALRELDLSRFGVVHFATHALVDELHPGRSAIVLARDREDHDGLLQPREIVELELEGKLVVLSACSSASGAVVDGEGVMGLAHAMFEAGAHTVVGSLWPIRDDDALALFDRFYAHLDAGLPVAQALAAAQRDRIEAGAPPAAWAGVVVLGDGSLRRTPVVAAATEPSAQQPQGGPRSWLRSWPLLGLLGLACVGLWALADRRRLRG